MCYITQTWQLITGMAAWIFVADDHDLRTFVSAVVDHSFARVQYAEGGGTSPLLFIVPSQGACGRVGTTHVALLAAHTFHDQEIVLLLEDTTDDLGRDSQLEVTSHNVLGVAKIPCI